MRRSLVFCVYIPYSARVVEYGVAEKLLRPSYLIVLQRQSIHDRCSFSVPSFPEFLGLIKLYTLCFGSKTT